MLYKTSSKQGAFQVTEAGFIQVVPMFSAQPLWQEYCQAVTGFDVRYGAMQTAGIVVHATQDHIVTTLTRKNFDDLRALFPNVPITEVSELVERSQRAPVQPASPRNYQIQQPPYQQPQDQQQYAPQQPQQVQPYQQTQQPQYQQHYASQQPQQAQPPIQATQPKQKPKWLQLWYENDTKLTHVATYTNQKLFERELEKAYQHGWVLQGQSAQGGQISGRKVIGGALVGGLLTGGIGLGIGAMVGAKRGKGKTTVTYVRSPEWMAQQRLGAR